MATDPLRAKRSAKTTRPDTIVDLRPKTSSEVRRNIMFTGLIWEAGNDVQERARFLHRVGRSLRTSVHVLPGTLLVVLLVAIDVGCHPTTLPKTSSELVKGSTYLPLTPKPIVLKGVNSVTSNQLLNSLPNATMRISIGSRDESGSLTFGVGSIGQQGHSYEVIVDYVNYTTAYLPVCFTTKEMSDQGKALAGQASIIETQLGSIKLYSNTHVPGKKGSAANESSFSVAQKIPIYVGVGLRIQASVQILKGSVQLSLFGLGSAANAGAVSGTMVIQTLGVFGAPIAPLIPLPTDIGESSIQSAMQSVAAIKAKLYDAGVNVRPQVIGFETVFGSTAAIQLIEATIEGATIQANVVDGILQPDEIGPSDICAAANKAPSP